MNWKHFAAAVALGTSLNAAYAEEKRYSMDDLTALASQSAWHELAMHLEDIKPSARNAPWNELVEKTALGLLGSSSPDNRHEAFYTSEALIKRYPNLKKSQPVMLKRGEVGLAAYGHCFDDSYAADECLKEFRGFVQDNPNNPALQFAAGKLARLKLKHWAAVPFFAKALTTAGDERCKDEDVGLAVTSALALPSEGYETYLNDAKKLAGELCWDALRVALVGNLSAGEYYTTNTCPLLRAKGMDGSDVQQACAK